VILKVDASGTFLWKETYGGVGIDIGYEIIPSVDSNGFIITGKTFQGTEQYYLLKLNSDGMVGIKDPEAKSVNSLTVFPNPCSNEIFVVTGKGNNTSEILITNIEGKILMQQHILSDDRGLVKADISGLAKGLYFCMISSEGQPITRTKFIKL
jgi:hypothetical protein